MGNSVKKIAPSSNSGSPERTKGGGAMAEPMRHSSTGSSCAPGKAVSRQKSEGGVYDRKSADLQQWDAPCNWDWSRDGSLPRRRQSSEDVAGVGAMAGTGGQRMPSSASKMGSRLSGKPPLKAGSENCLQKEQLMGKGERQQRARGSTLSKEKWQVAELADNGAPELLEASCTMHTFTRRPKVVASDEQSDAESKQQSMRNVNSDRWHSRNNFSASGNSTRQSFLNQSAKTRQGSAVSSTQGSGTHSSQETQDTASSVRPRVADKVASGKQRVKERERLQVLPTMGDNMDEWYTDCGKELGRGNFGVVSVWQSKVSGEKVASKSISKSRLRSRKDVDEIRKEVLILQRLKGHKHICQLKEVFEDKEKIHLVMELCPGKALSHQILRRKRLTEPEAVHIFKQVVESVKWVHAQGVMHRDLKPENILLSAPTDPLKPTSVHVKLADFGLSVFLKDGEFTSGLAGSPYYFAPEVVNGGMYSKEADIWSLGVVLYVLLSGMLPFYGETDKEIFQHIREGKVVFHSKHWKGVSYDGRNLVLALLTKDSRQRPTASQLLEDKWFKLFS